MKAPSFAFSVCRFDNQCVHVLTKTLCVWIYYEYMCISKKAGVDMTIFNDQYTHNIQTNTTTIQLTIALSRECEPQQDMKADDIVASC